MPDLVSNDSPKITWIRRQYNIALLYKTAINFLSPIAWLVTYSNFSHSSFHERDSFSNLNNMLIKSFTQQDNIIRNIQGVNAKTNLASRKLAKKKAKKAVTTVKKAELMTAKKIDVIVTKLRKAEMVEKLVVEKKTLKTEVDIKKVNDQAAKNLQTTRKKSQMTKCKVALLIINVNTIKKIQSNKKTGKYEKS